MISTRMVALPLRLDDFPNKADIAFWNMDSNLAVLRAGSMPLKDMATGEDSMRGFVFDKSRIIDTTYPASLVK